VKIVASLHCRFDIASRRVGEARQYMRDEGKAAGCVPLAALLCQSRYLNPSRLIAAVVRGPKLAVAPCEGRLAKRKSAGLSGGLKCRVSNH
jgi:hypothetical protein